MADDTASSSTDTASGTKDIASDTPTLAKEIIKGVETVTKKPAVPRDQSIEDSVEDACK